MLFRTIAALDAVNRRAGHTVAWLALGLVFVQFAVVVLRHVFLIGFVWMQESVLYLYGALFMAGAGYTLLCDGHVRVDIFYRNAASRTKALIDLAGAVLLILPVCAVVAWLSGDYVISAWRLGERSSEALGLPLTFAYKTMIWVFALLVGLQGVSMALKCCAYLTGAAASYPPDQAGCAPATEAHP